MEPLIFDLRKVENYQDLYKDGALTLPIQDLIRSTICMGMPDITKANVQEFWARNRLLARIDADYELDWGLNYCEQLVGLKTNAPPKGKAAFLNFLTKKAYQIEFEEKTLRLQDVSSLPIREELRPSKGTTGATTRNNRAGPR